MWDMRYPADQWDRTPGGLHHPPRDPARRLRGGGEPERRALPAPDRRVRGAAADRPAHPHHRRRLCRPGVRHRLRQDHPGPRFQRLRGLAASPRRDRHRRSAPRRPDQHLHPGRGGARQPARGGRPDPRRLYRPGPLRGAQAGGRRPRGPGAAGPGQGPPAPAAPRRPLRCPDRALSHRSVVCARRAAGRARHRRGGGRAHPLRPGQLEEHLFRLDAQHPGLVHQPPDLVGAPHPRLV